MRYQPTPPTSTLEVECVIISDGDNDTSKPTKGFYTSIILWRNMLCFDSAVVAERRRRKEAKHTRDPVLVDLVVEVR